MDIRSLAIVAPLVPPAVQSKAGHWDWEDACTLPDLGITSAFKAVASWLASKFPRLTLPALRAART
jgi:hypothetical protein